MPIPQMPHAGVTEQRKAAGHRHDDARVLLEGKRYRGAMYMAGYAIECALKALLMKKHNCSTLDELQEKLVDAGIMRKTDTIYDHSLERLTKYAQAQERLRQDLALWRAYSTVNHWVVAWRYDTRPTGPEQAQDFLEAVGKFRSWIENNI